MAQVSENATMENHTRYHGNLIAFEGPDNLLSTQLHLLPTSSQVLVLPSLQHYIDEDCDTRFDARSYIKSVHQAAFARHEAALQFLNNATRNNKRLVFLHGGTAAAVSQCISVISKRQTAGDVFLAEAIYKNIAGEGVRGLDQQEKYANQEALERLNSERDLDEALWEDEDGEEDPITKAMRAADALYKETESLQPIDCYIRTRPRSLSLSMLDYANELGQASPFFVFGSAPSEVAPSVFDEDEEESSIKGTEEDSTGARALKRLQGGQRLRISVPHRPVNSMAEAVHARNVENRSTIQNLSPTAEGFPSPPTTPGGVVYGEARLVQMRASKSQDLRKTRSLDDMELVEARRRRISIHMPAAKRASPIDSPEAKSRHLSIVEDPYSPNNLLHLPLAKFVKAQTTTIRKSPTFLKALSKPARDTYVHQGTEAADFGSENADIEDGVEPVLPLCEDLVVHFTSFNPDYLLTSVIQSFKDGLYPILGNISESYGTAETDSCPSTPRTADLFNLEGSKGDGLSPVAEVPSADEASDYDPYAARGNDVRCGSKMSPQQQQHQQYGPPSTPGQTNAVHVEETRFHEFVAAGRPNAIVTQNELRSVLEGYFPHQNQEDGGYLQFNSSLLPDVNKLWRPIFHDFEAQESSETQHTADLILAIGCQNGVKSELVSALTGQIERLGSKPNGMCRNGRLDIRYLIAIAVQSHSTQTLTSLSDKSLSDSPYSLACLLIPHLDTYLATNTATRFLLLSYPAEHLATVLALQKLLGADLFKTVGILDNSEGAATSSTPPREQQPSPSPSSSSSHLPYPSFSAGPASNAYHLATIVKSVDASWTLPTPPPLPLPMPMPAVSEARSTLAHRRRLSFSRADYVLTSAATEPETAALVLAIGKVLVDIDPFYNTPEPPAPSSSSSSRGRSSGGAVAVAAAAGGSGGRRVPTLVSKFTNPTSPPLSPPYSGSGAGSDEAATPRSLVAMNFPHSPLTLSLPPPPPPPPHSLPLRDESPSRSSVKSGRGRQQQHIAAAATARSRRGEDVAMMGGMAVDAVDEGEFDDAEERRLMPMYMRQSELRKGNSRKALKWLGLS